MSAIFIPGFEYHLSGNSISDMKDEPVGVMRQVRLDLRVLLNQGDGTYPATNAVADDIAFQIVRNLRTGGYLS